MAGLLKTLFDAIRRIRGRKEAQREKVVKDPPSIFSPSNEDEQFLEEIGFGPEDLEQPYRVPTRGRAPAVPSEVMKKIVAEDWFDVSSSNVDRFRWRYFGGTETIEVEFLSGSLYRYRNCTLNDAMQFWAAASSGRYVWYVLREGETRREDGSWNPGSVHPFTKVRDANRTTKINPKTGKGYVVFKPRRDRR